jgi:hypothetical protein
MCLSFFRLGSQRRQLDVADFVFGVIITYFEFITNSFIVLYKLKGCEKMGHGAMGNSGRFRSMQHGLVSLVDITPTATVSDVVARSARGS